MLTPFSVACTTNRACTVTTSIAKLDTKTTCVWSARTCITGGCPWWFFFASYLAWFAAWGVAAALLCLASMGQSHFACVLISVAQSIHIISRFSIDWSPFPMYVLRTFAIFNFWLEMLPWTCYGIRMA
jgi:hypothetical protein